jgi:hypothetical protein
MNERLKSFTLGGYYRRESLTSFQEVLMGESQEFLPGSPQGCGSGSGSGLVPYSIGSVDPDPVPYSKSGSGSGSRRVKMTHISRQKFVKVHVLKCWMASFESRRLLL